MVGAHYKLMITIMITIMLWLQGVIMIMIYIGNHMDESAIWEKMHGNRKMA